MGLQRTELKDSSWHSLPAQNVLDEIKTDPAAGLSSREVESRRAEFGFNRLTPKRGMPLWLMFLLQFHQPLIYILLVAAAVTFLLKEWVDAAVIFGVTVMTALQVLFTYLPVMNRFFHSAPIDAYAWMRILAAGILVYLSVRLVKKINLARRQ